MNGIGGVARWVAAWALAGAAGLAALASCAVQNGQPCMIRPDGSCVVLQPVSDAGGAYYDPEGSWTFVSNYEGPVGTIGFDFVAANTLADSEGVGWTYAGDNTWNADDGSVLQLRSPDEGYIWFGREGESGDEGALYRE
jgi:hypothetical protein